ncbi:MAG: hypothetical protein QNJ97_11470 [Myxococcota bacterium]|nr:hypothetical protein [Myxococcota bacterium]
MAPPKSKFRVNMEFHAVKLPPVKDILVLGKKYPQGKTGVMECFRFIAPDEFEMFENTNPDEVAEAVVINKRILARMPTEQVIELLREHVFPYISPGEAINVNFDIIININGVEIERQP